MSDLDRKYLDKGSGLSLGTLSNKDKKQAYYDAMGSLNNPIGQVTSRDQIINPESLLDTSFYQNTVAGRKRYESDLAALRNYQSQQEAAYQEWYESPEQAAIREREAGINPDLAGLQNAGEASEAPVSDIVPGQTLPTFGQQILSASQGFVNLVQASQGIASLSFLPLQKTLLNSQIANQRLLNKNLGIQGNILEFQEYSAVAETMDDFLASGLAEAQQKHLDSGSDTSFDAAAWINDSNRFHEWAFPYGASENYEHLFKLRQKRALQLRTNARTLQKDFAKGNLDFMEVYTDPRNSPDDVVMMAQMIPYANAKYAAEKAELAVREAYARYQTELNNAKNPTSEAAALNAQNKYTADYFNGLKGDVVAAYENFLRVVDTNSQSITDQINSHYKSMMSDPNSEEGKRAIYLYNSGSAASWSDYYMATHLGTFNQWVQKDTELKGIINMSGKLSNIEKAVNIATFPLQMNMEGAKTAMGFIK